MKMIDDLITRYKKRIEKLDKQDDYMFLKELEELKRNTLPLLRIKNEEHLRSFENTTGEKFGHKTTTDTPILFYRDGKLIVSQEWFINRSHELIYKVEENRFLNLEMYEKGESFTKDLYVII